MLAFQTRGGPVMTVESAGGGYEFIPGPPFASNGVIASSGMTIERGVFAAPILLPEGYETVRTYLDSVGRPLAALWVRFALTRRANVAGFFRVQR
jgi:hypothetical protein